MRATMTPGLIPGLIPGLTPSFRHAAVRRAGRFCLAACLLLSLIQFGLTPWLGLRVQILISAVVASLALQGIALMMIVSLGRVRFVAVRRRARDLELWRVRSVWRQHEPVLTGE